MLNVLCVHYIHGKDEEKHFEVDFEIKSYVIYLCLFPSNVKVTNYIYIYIMLQTKLPGIVIEFLTHIQDLIGSESQLGQQLS
jgi:hypothetical protein